MTGSEKFVRKQRSDSYFEVVYASTMLACLNLPTVSEEPDFIVDALLKWIKGLALETGPPHI